jgi:hypothetical protein
VLRQSVGDAAPKRYFLSKQNKNFGVVFEISLKKKNS